MLLTRLKYKELEKRLLIFIQMNFPPQTSWFLIVGASSEGGLRRPLAENTKYKSLLKYEKKMVSLLKYKMISIKIVLSVKAGTWLQISVGMKNFSMAW